MTVTDSSTQTHEPEPDEVEPDEVESDKPESDEVESDETDESESDKPESDETDESETDEVESDESDESETDEVETDEVDSDEVDSDELETDELETDEPETDGLETAILPVASAEATPTRRLPRLRMPSMPTLSALRREPEAPTEAIVFVPPEPKPLAMLEGRNVSAWFGDHQVLDRVSLTMPAGVITSLIGPSGCGKSTFLRILNRMHELVPSASLAGEVLLDGVDIYDPERKLVDARKSIGMVFQKPNPFPAMSIYDNVIAGLTLTGASASRDEKDFLVESCLTKAGLWKEVKDRLRAPGGGLSGGQQQRLCIARSLAVTPQILLMDEPCSALDPTSTRVIEETMLELANEVTIVIVTHNMQQAQRVSTQCAFFLAAQGTPGGIVEHGSTEAMFDSPIDSRTFDYVNGRFG